MSRDDKIKGAVMTKKTTDRDAVREAIQNRDATKSESAPQPTRHPLTDEQILSIVRAAPALDTAEAEWLHVSRAIERAHGIGGEDAKT